MTLIYCDNCESHQPIVIDWMQQDATFPEQGIWGDLVCSRCRLVLNSIVVDDEGIYEFKKVSDLPLLDRNEDGHRSA